MSSFLVRTIVFLLAAISTSGLLQCSNTANQCSSFAALRYPNYYLGCDSTVNTLETENLEACVMSCLKTPYCFSTNLKHSNESSKCELLKKTKKVTPRRCLTHKDGWEHIEVTHHKHCGGENHGIEREVLQDGWYRFNGTKLKHFLERKTWGEAKSYCQSIGGDLATISNEVINTLILGIMSSSLPGTTENLIGHWKLDGTDPDVTLFGASYQTVDGHKSLYLNGTSYATVPAFDLTPDFTLMLWVRIPEIPSSGSYLLADWSGPHKFNFGLNRAGDRFKLNVRNIATQNIVTTTFSVGVPKQTWFHLAVSVTKNTKTTAGYVNSVLKATATSCLSCNWTYMVNSHTVYDIGLKRDSGDTFKGHIKDLAVFGKALSQEEINRFYRGNYEGRGTWIGLNDVRTEGSYTWSDGSTATFVNWASGQPSGIHKLEDCVKIVSSKWDDASCGTMLNFVCKAT